MKKNKGFTLIEMVVIICLLGIIIGIAYPETLKFFKKSKDNVFVNESLEYYNNVFTSYQSDFLETSTKVNRYCYGPNNALNKLHMTHKEGYYYDIVISNGNITTFKITDGNKSFDFLSNESSIDKNKFIRSNIKYEKLDIDCSL